MKRLKAWLYGGTSHTSSVKPPLTVPTVPTPIDAPRRPPTKSETIETMMSVARINIAHSHAPRDVAMKRLLDMLEEKKYTFSSSYLVALLTDDTLLELKDQVLRYRGTDACTTCTNKICSQGWYAMTYCKAGQTYKASAINIGAWLCTAIIDCLSVIQSAYHGCERCAYLIAEDIRFQLEECGEEKEAERLYNHFMLLAFLLGSMRATIQAVRVDCENLYRNRVLDKALSLVRPEDRDDSAMVIFKGWIAMQSRLRLLYYCVSLDETIIEMRMNGDHIPPEDMLVAARALYEFARYYDLMPGEHPSFVVEKNIYDPLVWQPTLKWLKGVETIEYFIAALILLRRIQKKNKITHIHEIHQRDHTGAIIEKRLYPLDDSYDFFASDEQIAQFVLSSVQRPSVAERMEMGVDLSHLLALYPSQWRQIKMHHQMFRAIKAYIIAALVPFDVDSDLIDLICSYMAWYKYA